MEGMFGAAGGSKRAKVGLLGLADGSSLGFLRAFWAGPETDPTKQLNWIDVSRYVYHYTTVRGFMGIVESGGFWASDNRFMNDSVERSHGREFAAEIVAEEIARVGPASSFGQILAEVRKELLVPNSRGQLVTCFSLSCDNLDQWRGYGAGGGICIELDTNMKVTNPVFGGALLLRHRVTYSDDAKADFIRLTIRKYEREHTRDTDVKGSPLPNDEPRQYSMYLLSSMAGAVAGFKHRSFVSENEVRLVIPFEALDKCFDEGLQFRSSEYGPVPYVNTAKIKPGIIPWPVPGQPDTPITFGLPISRVIIGPSSRQQLIADSVSTYLQHKGYPQVSVELSSVPFRGS